MENIRNLLNQIKSITNKNDEILDATGARFNMFKICGVNHYENTHSAILAEFLHPNGAHGLKSKPLERFVALFGNDVLKNNFNYEKAQVIKEYNTDYGRIDILIEDNRNNAIIIENKIYAADQWEQLKRYDKYACTKYGNYQIFYLTLRGSEASEQSGKDVNYKCLAYENQIIEWLEQCVAIAVHFPIVRETLNQYINHLKTLTDQDMDSKNREELIKMIASNPHYIKSALEVSKIWESCKKEIINQLKPHIQVIAQKLELEPYIDRDLGQNETGFWFKKPEWDYSILFWFESNHFMSVGVDDWELPNNTKCSKEKKIRLKEFLNGFVVNKSKDNWIWGANFNVWNNCAWEDVEKDMPQEIEKMTKTFLEKLSSFEN